MHIRPIAPSETRPLRQAILRPNQPIEKLVYPFDEQDTTVHFGSALSDRPGEPLCGIVSLAINPYQGEHATDLDATWQLRGMATTPEVRGTGAGKALVLACTDHVRQHAHLTSGAIAPIWCNARIGAVGFYERMGFEVVSGEFDIPDIGPHFVMVWRLE